MSQLFRLKNGTVLLSTEAPGGIYNSGQLKKIAELCSKELAIVKATEDQRLALFVKESEVENVAQQLRAMGLGFRHYQDSLHQPVSCLGELCEEHEQPAMATAMDITKEIAAIQLNTPLKIGVNGCARCCTPCHTLDIAVVGDASGYRISLGGKTRQMPEFASYFAEGVPPKELPKRLKAVIETFKNLADDGETLHDVIERCGVADFVKALAPYSQDAAQREDPFVKDKAAEDDLELIDATPAEDDDLELIDETPADDGLESIDDVPIAEDRLELSDDALLPDDSLESIDDAPIAEDSLELSDDGAAAAEDSLETIEDNLDLSDEAPLEDSLTLEDSDLSVADSQLDDDVSLDEIPITREDQGSLEDDLDLTGGDLTEDQLDVDSSSKIPEDDIDLEETASTDDLELGADLDGLDASTASEEPLEDVAMETIDDIEDVSLDESAAIGALDEAELVEDASETELVADAPLDEDLEGLPELDEDLALDEEAPAPVVAAAKPAAPAPQPPMADFGDEDMPGDVPDLSDDEESQFEQKLHASIDEESRLLAKADKDPNVGVRQAALSLLENNELGGDELELSDNASDELELPADVDEPEEIELSEDLGDLDETPVLDDTADLDVETPDLEVATENSEEELEPINEPMEEFPEPGPSDLAQIGSRQLGQKLQGSSNRQQFKVSAITFQDEHMRVTFESGAYVDFDLSALGHGEERSFRLGAQSVSVTSTSEGYILEVDGMRLFHPKSSLPVAS